MSIHPLSQQQMAQLVLNLRASRMGWVSEQWGFHHCSSWGCCTFHLLFLSILFTYLFIAVLCLCCRMWAFSSWSKQGLLFSCNAQGSHCSGFSCFGAQSLMCTGFSGYGPVAWGIFRDQGSNPVPLAGRFLTIGHSGKSYAFNIATVLNQDCSRLFYSQIMATHSSVLAWEILWTEEPGRLQFMGSPELDTT